MFLGAELKAPPRLERPNPENARESKALFARRFGEFMKDHEYLPPAENLYKFTALCLHTAFSEATMEHLVRICNEKDRRTLAWLRRHVGDAAIALAVQQYAGPGKPYISAVCRRLGVQTPDFSVSRRQTSSPIAQHSLATVRSILAARTTAVKPVATSTW
jgi:hypothetical protein